MVGARRVYGPARDNPVAAHSDAVAMRKADAALPALNSTIGDLAEQLLAELQGVRSPATLSFYRQQLHAVYQVVRKDAPAAKVTPQVLRELVRVKLEAGYSAQTISHYRRVLHRVFSWALRRGLVEHNPVPLLDWPQPRPQRPDVLSEQELAAVLEQLRTVPADYDLVLLACLTGLRRAELARLHTSDVDMDGGFLWVRGKRRDEPVPIAEQLRPSLQAMLERAGEGCHLIPGGSEQARTYTVANTFRRWAKRLGDRRFHPHALRHSLATALIRSGVEPARVQRMLRHSSYATTQRYVHLVADDLRAAAGRLRLLPASGEEQSHG